MAATRNTIARPEGLLTNTTVPTKAAVAASNALAASTRSIGHDSFTPARLTRLSKVSTKPAGVMRRAARARPEATGRTTRSRVGWVRTTARRSVSRPGAFDRLLRTSWAEGAPALWIETTNKITAPLTSAAPR